MSYPPPPGVHSKASNSAAPHPSLPARPPPSSNFKPAFPQAPRSTFTGFAPRSVAPPQTQPAPQQSYPNYASQPPSSYQQQQPAYHQYGSGPSADPAAYGAPPQIRNPFPINPPSHNNAYDEDPDMAANIAQWQSAYSSGPSNGNNSNSGGYTGIVRKQNYHTPGEGSGSATSANAAPLGNNRGIDAAMSSQAHNDTGVATVVSDAKTNTKTVVRTGGGTTWTDSSLLEWDPSHFRIFVGNLAGEVTDEALLKAFSKWPSAVKAKVVRDKRTTKSKGFGFVAFTNGDEYFDAARTMNGKYIGSHPVLIRKSTTEIKAVNPKDNHKKNKYKGGKGKGDLDKTGAGVQKAGSKTKGGMKLLG